MGMRECGDMTVVDDHWNTGYDWMLEKQTRTSSCACHSRPWRRHSFLAREEEEALQRLNNLDLDLLNLAINDAMLHAFLLRWRRHHDRVSLHVIIRPCPS